MSDSKFRNRKIQDKLKKADESSETSRQKRQLCDVAERPIQSSGIRV